VNFRTVILLSYLFLSYNVLAQPKITSLYGLVAYYPLNGDAVDNGKYALDGKLHGEILTIPDRFNKPDAALWFTGNQSYIEIPHHKIFDLNQFSVSVWYYDSLSLQNPILSKSSLIDEDAAQIKNNHYKLFSSNVVDSTNEQRTKGEIKFDMLDTDSEKSTTYANKAADVQMWHHLVVTYSVRETKIYIDGDLARRHYINKNILNPQNPGPLLIGASFIENQLSQATDTLFRVGALDELCIFNRPINDRDTRNMHKRGRKKIFTKKTINVKAKELLIKVWDDGQVDEDTISLLVNNRLILENHKLDKEKYELTIQLTKTHNYIELKAENLGNIPPNTAAISISDGKSERKIELSSTYEVNDAVEVIYIGNN